MFILDPLTLLDRMNQAATFVEASEILQNALAANGFRGGIYMPCLPHHNPNPNPIRARTLECRCVDSADSHSFFSDLSDLVRIMPNDPIIAHLRNNVRPWIGPIETKYHDLFLLDAATIPPSQNTDLMVYFPIHGANGSCWVFGLHVPYQDPNLIKWLREHIANLHLAVFYLYSIFNVKLSSEMVSINLAARERECLRWVAAGLSSKRIAYKLGLSIHTVNEFIGNAMRKLDAKTRSEAVTKAISAKLINP